MGTDSDAKSTKYSTGDGDPLARARELADGAPRSEVVAGVPFLGHVNNVVEYGVFVSLTESSRDEISGLVYKERLPGRTQPEDYERGDRMVVELHQRKDNGDLSFTGLAAPDVEDPSGDGEDSERGERALMAEIMDRLDRLEAKAEAINAVEDADAPVWSMGIPDAVAELKRLQAAGYAVESLATESREGGDVVELNVTVSKSGDTDD